MSVQQHALWQNRWTFILAATGSAVGLGNIWKFPYITGEYGGGAFVLVYLFCILTIGVPIMVAEVWLGKRGRHDPINSLRRICHEAGVSGGWTVIGIAGVLGGLLILMFYGVVAGWALEYVWQSFKGSYTTTNLALEGHFGELTASSGQQIFWQTIFMLLTCGVIAAGVVQGIGRSVNILMPTLLLLLIMLLAYSLLEGDGASAARFMFAPDFSKLSGEAVLVALGHAFFTLSLAMGAMLAYGSYMPDDAHVGKTVLTVAALDTIIALVAGMAIFPVVFANGLAPGSGPGLMFVTLPLSFAAMPMGNFFGGLFFALVAIAALSSSISLLEPGIAWLEEKGVPRVAGAIGLGLVAWGGGLASIYSGEVFDFLDKITAQYMMPLGGLLIALLVGWALPRQWVRGSGELAAGSYNAWYLVLRYITPPGILLVFAHSLGLL